MAEEGNLNITNQQELQQAVMYLENIKQQIVTLKDQFEILYLAVNEHQQAIDTLNGFKNLTDDNELLIPIGGDLLVFAKVKDVSKVIINIGAGIAMEDKLDDAITKLNSRIVKIEENKNKLNSTIENLQSQAMMLSSNIEEKYQSLQGASENDLDLGSLNVS